MRKYISSAITFVSSHILLRPTSFLSFIVEPSSNFPSRISSLSFVSELFVRFPTVTKKKKKVIMHCLLSYSLIPGLNQFLFPISMFQIHTCAFSTHSNRMTSKCLSLCTLYTVHCTQFNIQHSYIFIPIQFLLSFFFFLVWLSYFISLFILFWQKARSMTSK